MNHPLRALIIEDDESLSEAIVRGLRAEDFTPVVESNGLAGLERASAEEFSVIVADLMLPGMNGYQVCRALRDRSVNTPVLVLTAKIGEYDEVEALETGADDFMSKPFSFPVFVARLRALIRRGATAGRERLEAGDLVLDPVAHLCWRGETEISLTPREFALAEYLLRHAGRSVSKIELLDEVWREAAPDTASNLVEVYVGYLRRKLDVPFDRAALQTVRGIGYRLDPAGG